ncbi:MAG: glycosyltransferase family 4 protein [Gammaproteobacteria bacterium]
MKLLFLVANDAYFISHRLELAKSLQEKGIQIALACMPTQYTHLETLQATGITVFNLPPISRSAFSLKKEWSWLRAIYKICKNYEPNIIQSVALKPILYGALISKWLKIQGIFALGGLGYLFTDSEENKIKKSLKFLKRYLVTKALAYLTQGPKATLVLQNQDDAETLKKYGIKNYSIIPGNGIRLPQTKFYAPKIDLKAPVKIAFAARMLWDKGIAELISAIEILKKQDPLLNFQVDFYGLPDPENPSSVPKTCLEYWHQMGLIHWHGNVENIPSYFSKSDIVVLPSYREGFPKTLLEALITGNPIVATDVPGCRSLVKQGYNGHLVPAKDHQKLAFALLDLIQNPNLRDEWGYNSLEFSKQFSIDVISKQFLDLYL